MPRRSRHDPRRFSGSVSSRRLGILLAFPSALPAQPPPRAVKPEEELVEKVRKAIDNGVKFLKKQQSPQGNWEGDRGQSPGRHGGRSTALVTLALLNCGVKPTDPAVAEGHRIPSQAAAEEDLRRRPATWSSKRRREKKDLPRIQKNAEWLIAHGIGWTANADLA